MKELIPLRLRHVQPAALEDDSNGVDAHRTHHT
jgi:hypothetical protein